MVASVSESVPFRLQLVKLTIPQFQRALQERLRVYHLELHAEKTQIVCCQVKRQDATDLAQKFTFLGYEFRPRLVRSRQGKMFVAFTPALSPGAAKHMRQRIRRWRLNLQTSRTLEEIAHEVNPIVRGWITYFGAYHRSSLYPMLRQLDLHLVQWVKRKWTKKGRYFKCAKHWLGKTAHHRPKLFVHWKFGVMFPAG